MLLDTADPLAVAVVAAIQGGDVPGLRRLLAEHGGLASAGIGDDATARSLLHVATDWPGHRPHGADVVATLVAAGADVHARFVGPHTETPLHWAASNDDVEVLDALLDAGAEIDAGGAVIADGTPLTDARAFGQWNAARRLVERGARVDIRDEAALGLADRLERRYAAGPPPRFDTDSALWYACQGGQQAAVDLLLARGADLDWIPPWENLTPLDAARRNGFTELAGCLEAAGARSAS